MEKRLLLFSCLCFLLFPLPIWGVEDAKELDGYEWEKASLIWKLGFVRGWMEGAEVAGRNVPFAIFMTNKKMEPKKRGEELRRQRKIVKHVSKEYGLELYDLTFGQIVDTIDKLYKDPRIKKWGIGEVMPLARGRLKEGWTEKDLDEVIAYYIKLNEWNKKFEKTDSSSKESEYTKLNEEFDSILLNQPKVLRALESYKFE